MNIIKIVEDKLQKFPIFRERKERSKFLSLLAMRECELEDKFKTGQLTLDDIGSICVKYSSYERAWPQNRY